MAAPQLARANVWIDVEDLIAHCVAEGRPGDIERLAFDIMSAMRAAEPDRVRLVRRGGQLLVEAEWAEVAELMHRTPAPLMPSMEETGAVKRVRVINAIESLPEHLRVPLFRAGLLQTHALRNWSELARALRTGGSRPGEIPARPAETGQLPIQPGDTYLMLGAGWRLPDGAAFVAAVREAYGVSAHLLLHDLLPVRHPEWCTRPEVAAFRDWLDAGLTMSDGLMATSNTTAEDVEAYASERGLTLRGPVRPIPIGTGFGPGRTGDGAAPVGLPAPGSYALLVSAVDMCANQELAFRVWRHLYDEVLAGTRRPELLPTLVFAGQVGRLSSDLLQQLDNTRWLDGRIRLIPDPSDRELRALYAGCLFTVLPSWSESWVGPVGESLAAGKPCFASRNKAFPEAGGTLCRTFDPGNVGQAQATIAAVLDAPGALASWQDRIRGEFRPVPWTDTAEAIFRCLAPVPA